MATLDLRSVDIFRAVAETGSATHAAAALGTTQPTITRAVAEFEALCGLKLFDRGRFGMRLTAEGHLLLEAVQRSYAGLKFIGEAVDNIRAGAHGVLRFVAIPVLGEGILSDLLGEFLGRNPNIRLSIDLDSPARLLRAIAQDRADFAAIAGPLPDGSDCEILVVAQAALELIVGARDPLAGRGAVDFADLGGRDMALLAAPHVVRALTDSAMFNAGVKPRIAHEMITQRTVAAMVASGHCIGFVDSHIAATLDPRKIAVVPLKQRLTWQINLAWRRDRAPTRAMASFLAWLKARDIDRGRERAAS
jgi:DNA-binding transcriptional LysR family regulator